MCLQSMAKRGTGGWEEGPADRNFDRGRTQTCSLLLRSQALFPIEPPGLVAGLQGAIIGPYTKQTHRVRTRACPVWCRKMCREGQDSNLRGKIPIDF